MSEGETVISRLKAGKNVPVRPMAEAIGCHPNTLWKAIREGEVQSVKLGSCVFIPSPAGLKLLGLHNEAAIA